MKQTPLHPKNEAPASVERHIEELGSKLWRRINKGCPGIFSSDYWQGRLMELVMADDSFKLDLFRLIDVLPALDSTKQVANHMAEYLNRAGRTLPGFLGAGVKAASTGLMSGIAVKVFQKNVLNMAGQFIVGENPKAALTKIRAMHKEGMAFTADLLGEATVSKQEGDAYLARYLELVDTLADAAPTWAKQDLVDNDHEGPIPRANISVKISALCANLNPLDPTGSVARLKEQVLPLLQRAKSKGVFVNFDIEQWTLHEITMRLFEELASDPQFSDWPHIGIVVQAYLKSASQDFDKLLALANKRTAPMTIRLVKGAYWDYEVVRSQQHGYPCPVFLDKAATDANFEELSALLLEHHAKLRPAFATHNLRSTAHAIARAEYLEVPKSAFEFQTLFGMAEPERKGLRDSGFRVRVYVPIGEMLPGIAYFIRRLLENTANSGFLRMSHHDKVDIKRLLRKPEPKERPAAIPNAPDSTGPSRFENCPLLDFTDPAVRTEFAQAVEARQSAFPLDIPVVIGGVLQVSSANLKFLP